MVPRSAYDDLWKQWGLTERPADFDARVRERYGLHDAPYPNDDLPMGLRATPGRRGPAVGVDCMLCHGSSLFGTSYVGLPNTSLDLYGLFRDLDRAGGGLGVFPYTLSNVRGTTESTASAVWLIALRDADLNFRLPAADLGPDPRPALRGRPGVVAAEAEGDDVPQRPDRRPRRPAADDVHAQPPGQPGHVPPGGADVR
jgi:hypothetical protein